VSLILLEGAASWLCAGGDIRGLYDSARAGGDLGKIFWREEYILNARIARFQSLCGVHGRHRDGGAWPLGAWRPRIVTDRTRLGMPEVAVGFFPMSAGPGCCRARRANSAPISD